MSWRNPFRFLWTLRRRTPPNRPPQPVPEDTEGTVISILKANDGWCKPEDLRRQLNLSPSRFSNIMSRLVDRGSVQAITAPLGATRHPICYSLPEDAERVAKTEVVRGVAFTVLSQAVSSLPVGELKARLDGQVHIQNANAEQKIVLSDGEFNALVAALVQGGRVKTFERGSVRYIFFVRHKREGVKLADKALRLEKVRQLLVQGPLFARHLTRFRGANLPLDYLAREERDADRLFEKKFTRRGRGTKGGFANLLYLGKDKEIADRVGRVPLLLKDAVYVFVSHGVLRDGYIYLHQIKIAKVGQSDILAALLDLEYRGRLQMYLAETAGRIERLYSVPEMAEKAKAEADEHPVCL